MRINKIDNKVLNLLNGYKVIRKVNLGPKEYKKMHDACYKLGELIGQPASRLQEMTKGADVNRFTFLKTMVNKFNYQNFHNVQDNSEHILNIYSMVEKPTALHLNIVRKSKNTFNELEKIFSMAKDKETLQYVEDLQYGELADSKIPSKIILDILNSKNRLRYVEKPENYSSYLRLHANNEDAISNLDRLIETGKYRKFRSDAQLAIKKLMRNKKIEVAMEGKTSDLEKMYSKDRTGFLTSLIRNFIPNRKAPSEDTKAVVVKMYGSLDSKNSNIRNAIIERFKNAPIQDRTAEIVEMQNLFNRIDKDKDAKIFVQKAISKDLKIGSIAELNEVINVTPLKKANVFFNNAKRIIERSVGEERKSALTLELENPFFESKIPQTGKKRIVRMFADRPQHDGFFTRTVKIIENKINQYRYSRMSA